MTTSPAMKRPAPNPTRSEPKRPGDRDPRYQNLTHALHAALGLPHAKRVLGDSDHDQARALLPGWAIEIRESTTPRLKGWWQCALDRSANHGGRPLLVYRINVQPWRAILAVRDLNPALATAAPQLHVEMDLAALAEVIRSAMPTRFRPAKNARG